MDIKISVTLPSDTLALTRQLTNKPEFVSNLALAALIVKRGEDMASFGRVLKKLCEVSRDIKSLRESGNVRLFLSNFLDSDEAQYWYTFFCEKELPDLYLEKSEYGDEIIIPGRVRQYTVPAEFPNKCGRPRSPYTRSHVLWGIKGLFDREGIKTSITDNSGSESLFIKIATAVLNAGGVDKTESAVRKLAERAGIKKEKPDGLDINDIGIWSYPLFPVNHLGANPLVGLKCKRQENEAGLTVTITYMRKVPK